MERGRSTSSSENLLDDFEDDYVVKSIGAFGVWQATVCVIAALVRSAAIWNMLSIIFLTPATQFVCVKFEDNATVLAQNSTCYNNCVEYMYYEEVLERTLISEFGLICDGAWKASFTQSMLMFGFLIGVSLFGWISDRFGRRIGLIISCTLNITFMLAVPFSQSYWIFNTLRLFIGMASGGTMIISLVFIIEIVGPQHREAAGSLAILPDGLAQGLLSVFAYYSVDWRMFLMEYAIASVVIYMFIVFLPESPRWLMSKDSNMSLSNDDEQNIWTQSINGCYSNCHWYYNDYPHVCATRTYWLHDPRHHRLCSNLHYIRSPLCLHF
ncbi:organic cation/carnitine transporter 4-like [Helicoverpa zea]|uniref:organic cation/carnitine transporter 4-like n=1 Tax=Helicoverpa zea TaxID=7113 RepID=UPI001F56DCA7|nr:organic cation/carnitine transporter 4-like [Helicoverpa zea]